MKISLSLLAAVLLLFAPVYAQPPAPDLAPRVADAPNPVGEPQAREEYEQLLARYAALKSYSDTTTLSFDNAGLMEQKHATSIAFKARLAWEKPNKVRLEGERAGGKFLSVSDGNTLQARQGEHAGYYVRRGASPRIFEGVNEVQVGAPGFGVMWGDGTLQSMEKQGLTQLKLLPNVSVEGVDCRVLFAQIGDNDGSEITVSFFVGAKDGLMRRVVNSYTRGEKSATFTEIHSGIETNPALPAETWRFQPLDDTKPVSHFASLEPDSLTLKVKVGEPLPPFASPALDGTLIRSSQWKGAPVLLHFFAIHNAAFEVRQLTELSAREGGLRIVGVSMDARRDRVERFVAENNIAYPVVFDGGGWKNALATLLGVRSLLTTLLIDRDGILSAVGRQPTGPEFDKKIQALLR